MKKIPRMILGCTLAAALALTACSRSDSGSSGSMSTNMGGSSSQTGQAGQNTAYRTGLGILTEASDQERTGKIDTIAAAVLLDAEGRVADVMLDEVEISVTGDSTGKVTMPTDDRTKRQKGDDYPLAAVSSLKKGWAEQADAFGNYLTGKTPDEVKKLATDDDGKPKDADLLSTCTIAVDGYRDAVVRACENAKAVGSARGDRAVLGVSVRNDTKELTADDDHDVTAQVDITVAALHSKISITPFSKNLQKMRTEIKSMNYYNVSEVAARIRGLRNSHGFTQEKAAQLLDIDRSFMSRIENGSKGCSVDLLIRLSELYHVSLDYLILGRAADQVSLKENLEKVIQQLTDLCGSI